MWVIKSEVNCWVTNKSRTQLEEWVWGDREIGGKPNYQIKECRSACFQNNVGNIRLLWEGQAGKHGEIPIRTVDFDLGQEKRE